jgi:hypothetical protein
MARQRRRERATAMPPGVPITDLMFTGSRWVRIVDATPEDLQERQEYVARSAPPASA